MLFILFYLNTSKIQSKNIRQPASNTRTQQDSRVYLCEYIFFFQINSKCVFVLIYCTGKKLTFFYFSFLACDVYFFYFAIQMYVLFDYFFFFYFFILFRQYLQFRFTLSLCHSFSSTSSLIIVSFFHFLRTLLGFNILCD